MKEKIFDIVEKIISIIYPNNLNCIICNMPISRNNKYSLCRTCREKLIFIQESCVRCGKPRLNSSSIEEGDEKSCRYCSNKNFVFDRNISFIEYDSFSKKIVFSLKYNRQTYISKIIARIIYDEVMKYNADEFKTADLIMYVPLSNERENKRGFNQAEKIAYYLSVLTKIEISDALYRKKNTKRLHKMKSKNRKKEIAGVFSIKEGYESIEGKNIILLDDIFTTGSTVNEISKELKLYGVNRVVSLTFLTGKYDE